MNLAHHPSLCIRTLPWKHIQFALFQLVFSSVGKKIGWTDSKPLLTWLYFCFFWQEGINFHVWSITVSCLCIQLIFSQALATNQTFKIDSLCIALHSFAKFQIWKISRRVLGIIYDNIQILKHVSNVVRWVFVLFLKFVSLH